MTSDEFGLPQSPAQAAEGDVERVARALHISCSRQDINGYLGAKIDCTVLAEVALVALGMRGDDALGIAREALEKIATDQPYRSGYCQTEIEYEPALSAEEAFHVAGSALARIAALSAEGSATIAAARPELRKLEWTEPTSGPDEYLTVAQAGGFSERYEIEAPYAGMPTSKWRVKRSSDIQPFAWAETKSEAKAKAQADFERRALVLPSSSPEDQEKA